MKAFEEELLIEVKVPEDTDLALTFEVESLKTEKQQGNAGASLLTRVTRRRRNVQAVEIGPAYVYRLNKIEGLKSREKLAKKKGNKKNFGPAS